MAKGQINFEKYLPYLPTAAMVLGSGYVLYKLTGGTGGQTPSDVKADGLNINAGNFKRPRAAYESAAETSYKIMNDSLVADDNQLLDLVRGMNRDELRQVYKDFGKRSGMIGIPLISQIKIGSEKDIFGWYTNTLSNNFVTGNHLDKMKAIWKVSGLWN